LIFPLFEHNVRAAGVAEMVRAHRGPSRDVLPQFSGASFDIIYIDASHRFEDVRFDIQQAKRLLSGDGIICGDDLELEASAVRGDELREAIRQGADYAYAESAGSHYHPGVTGAVGDEFPAVRVWNGFWAVQRRGSDWATPDLDVTMLQVPDHVQTNSETPLLIGSTEMHNLVQAGDRFFAISKALGPVALFEEYFGERELSPHLLVGNSQEEVRAKSEAVSSRDRGDSGTR
jgi:hypothetical protein